MANRNFRRQQQAAGVRPGSRPPAGALAGAGAGSAAGYRPPQARPQQQQNLPFQSTPGQVPGLGFGSNPQFGFGGFQAPGPISPESFSQMSPQQRQLHQQGYYQMQPGGSYFTAGGSGGAGSGRVIGAGSQFNTSGLNMGLINAYYQSPAARQLLDQFGMAPSYTGVNVSGPSGNVYGRTGGSDPRSLSGQSSGGIGFSPFLGGAPPLSAGTFRQNGMEIDRQTGLPANRFRPGGINHPYTQAGLAGSSSNFTRPGGGLGLAGVGAPQLPGAGAAGGPGLQRAVTGGISQEIASPSGLPTRQMLAESADAIGRSTSRGADELRESFARRGQTGTEAERAALRELEESSQRDRRSEARDIAQRDVMTRLQRRLQAMNIGANFLRGERSDTLGLLRSLIGGL